MTQKQEITQISNLEERARCSQRHIQGYLSQNELYPAGLPHQHLSYQTVPQVLQTAAVFVSVLFLFITKRMFTQHKSLDCHPELDAHT